MLHTIAQTISYSMVGIIFRMVLDIMAPAEMTVIAITGLGAATVVTGIIVPMVRSMTGCDRTPGPDRLRMGVACSGRATRFQGNPNEV